MLDVLTEVAGLGNVQDVQKHSVLMDVEGFTCRVLDLDSLIIAKNATGRRKDRDAVIELELIRDSLRREQNGPVP